MKRIILKQKPSLIASMARILQKRSAKKANFEFPYLNVIMENASIDRANLLLYRNLTGYEDDGKLPVLYPHAIASPIYMFMLSQKEFPLNLLGALHLKNRIISYRKISEKETFSIDVRMGKVRILSNGIEFDFSVILSQRDEILWKGVSTWFKRGNFGQSNEKLNTFDTLTPIGRGQLMCELEIPEDIGKRFAKVTGDYNPIHISPLMARLFGLKRNIIHAMWFCGFIGSKLFHLNKINPIQIDLAFRSPIFVGSKATVISEARDKNLRFDTYCQGNSKVCINGFIGEFTDER